MLISLHTTTSIVCCSGSRSRVSVDRSLAPLPHSSLRFHTAYHEKLLYLRNLGLVDSNPRSPIVPSQRSLDQILDIINYLKSKGFSENDISELVSTCPKLFSSHLNPVDIEPVFSFLAKHVSATSKESCRLILCCPDLLFSNVEYCLTPTFTFLKSLGIENLNVGSNLNAHLLNTRIGKLETKITFLRGIGFNEEDSMRMCARLPAIFGYSIENNLEPKVEYLIRGMQRSRDEIKEFPQYFAFSLTRRIAPRHMHLKQRGVHISLKRMLMSCDQKFYAKWK